VVGNPLIADVTLQPGGIVVVTGKATAPPISSPWIAEAGSGGPPDSVEGPADPIITVYRGIERESLTCMPVCQPR
jgi:hypothetical protein